MIEITEEIRNAAYDCDLASRVANNYNKKFIDAKHNQKVAEGEYNYCSEKLLSLISDYELSQLKEGQLIYLKVDQLLISISRLRDSFFVNVLEVNE